jgi:hypothetical protein
VLAKFILLLPRSGYCAKRLTEIDSNITYEKDRLEFRRTTSGSVGRDYGNSVLKIKDPDHDTKVCVIPFNLFRGICRFRFLCVRACVHVFNK